MLAELFNAMVSKLFINEYRELAERYYNERRLLFQENNGLMGKVAELVKQVQKTEAKLKSAEREVEELRTTIKTTQRVEHSDEQKQLLNAAMINIAAKETIGNLRAKLEMKTAELERCRKAAENEKALHDCVATERDRLLQEKQRLLQTAEKLLSVEDYEKFKRVLGGKDFANLVSAMKATCA